MRSLGELELADPWKVAQGHDMIEILRVGLQCVLGDIGTKVGQEQIARVLRAAVSREDLGQTGLCGAMRAWEVKNPGFWVLD